MLNRRIQRTKPYMPHSFGKKRKRRSKPDIGAVGEAVFILVAVGLFLLACFGGLQL